MLYLVLGLLFIWLFFLNPQNQDKEGFLTKLPYMPLETTHYKQRYYNKTNAECPDGNDQYCLKGPGHFKTVPGYYDDPSVLKDYYLGYSVNGLPYNDHKFNNAPSKKHYDVQHPNHRFHYPKWHHYNPRREADYIGYPFYFHGKQHS